MKRIAPISLLAFFLITSCSPVPPHPPTPVPDATPSPMSETPALGAGFRYSIYGPAYDPGPEYWTSVGERMSAFFPSAQPLGIWIIGDIEGSQAYLNFTGTSADTNIVFGETDDNEAALTYFDEHNVKIWLQVEPGDADMLTLIDLVLGRYGSHPCVIGFGVDVEWFHSIGGEAEGTPVSDAEAAAWVDAVRAYNPSYQLFLKHWDTAFMPPTVRDGIVFIDDSQQFHDLGQMVNEFKVWGETFAPAPVGFQFGYPDDQVWWRQLQNPPADIGNAILSAVPNTEALFWVDFTALEVFPLSHP